MEKPVIIKDDTKTDNYRALFTQPRPSADGHIAALRRIAKSDYPSFGQGGYV